MICSPLLTQDTELRAIGMIKGTMENFFKKQCCLDIRKNFFTQRVVKPWNNLTEDTVSQTKVNVFKKILRVTETPEAS